MENEIKLQALLGLKQEYVAMILKVTRTQWSMFVLGKRDLPINAKLKLAELLTFVSSDVDAADINALVLSTASKRRKIFETQQKSNLFQQMKVERKLTALVKKYEMAVASIKVIGFLEQSQSLSQHEQNFWALIKMDAVREMEKNCEVVQEKWQLKLKTLQFEAMLINEKL
jgi:plasmid maintenance system antidote protein VapI